MIVVDGMLNQYQQRPLRGKIEAAHIALSQASAVVVLRAIQTYNSGGQRMKIFGKSFSEYVRFEKVILWLIVVVGIGRLALSLAGVPNSVARWLSITAVIVIGAVYCAIKVHTSGFGSYKHLLPLLLIQDALAELIVAGGIVLAILTRKDNIFSAPEFSGGTDGKNWTHVGAHVLVGFVVAPLVFWIIGSLVMFVTKKITPRDTGRAAAAGA